MDIQKSPLCYPQAGNVRLKELCILILSEEATPEEEEEFTKISDLYYREMIGEKPWRKHPELYDDAERLTKVNKEKREKKQV